MPETADNVRYPADFAGTGYWHTLVLLYGCLLLPGLLHTFNEGKEISLMALSFPLRTIVTNLGCTMWLQCVAHF